MDKKKTGSVQPLREGVVKNNQVKTNPSIDKTAVLKPPPALPKKDK